MDNEININAIVEIETLSEINCNLQSILNEINCNSQDNIRIRIIKIVKIEKLSEINYN